MKVVPVLILAAGLLLVCGVAFAREDQSAEGIEKLKHENVELRQKVDSLEDALNEIKGLLKARPEPAAQGEKPSIRSKFSADLYGYLKFDAAYDTSRINSGNYARWVESQETNEDDDEFNATANESRFGLDLRGPDVAGMKTSGKVEIDFYGGGAENKPNPMMRHAYLQVDWPKQDFSILAAQTFDAIFPLVPTTLNYTVDWFAGNMGYRRPQLRLTKRLDYGKSHVVGQGAIVRTIGDSSWGFGPGDTGEDAGFPTTQGRVAVSFPLLTDKPTTIGLSGHWGQQEYDCDSAGHDKHCDSWPAG